MELTWFGHSNFRLAHGGAAFSIDPFFTGNPKAPGPWRKTLGSVDAVLVTHDHGDHLGQAVEISTERDIPLVGVFDTVCKLVSQGLPQELGLGMNLGGAVRLADVEVQMVQAMHSSASGTCAGYILTWPDGFCAYHSGDTALFGDMEMFGRFQHIHLAMLPIGGHFTMDPKSAAHACGLLGCDMVAPMHWGTFPILEQDTAGFSKQLQKIAPSVKLLDLAPGGALTV
ncbi:MAG TPA: metal-dependent hydrolase [Desulfovibrio sp.]|jgi:L-ascorbate metabolism protein UlaG (beta-lactamase superfamily)|uniref:metal-dependent hydrolase n=1 Tax=Desulfovibrio TaxID=872 RepID=UPI00041BBBD1|nr:MULTISPECIES: metal-dependent hydrolase [Desulfovibrio]MDY0307634.1 metal-dependent hydrolase [Desulfovibrionaceae bacterium]HMM37228.1 metal-dependent hydrolase [Desulfovibrio sp.]